MRRLKDASGGGAGLGETGGAGPGSAPQYHVPNGQQPLSKSDSNDFDINIDEIDDFS